MVLTFKRTDLIARLEKKRDSMVKDDSGRNAKLQTAAITELEEEIQRLKNKLERARAGKLDKNEYVNTNLGTYGPAYYGNQNNGELILINNAIAQLSLATDETIKIGEKNTYNSILRWLS